MSIKISPYNSRELRYDVEISPSNYCWNISMYRWMLDWHVMSLQWYRGLILGCVECRHGVSNWMSSSLSSRRLLLWVCLWMTLAGTVSPVGEHKVWEIYSDMCGGVWKWYLHVWRSPCVSICCRGPNS